MPATQPSMILGTWDLTIATPIGRLAVSMTFEDRGDGIAGTARGRGEDVHLRDITSIPNPPGERVTWTQSITKPLRLNLAFDVLVTGDTLTGTSRAGRLPASKVTGQRA